MPDLDHVRVNAVTRVATMKRSPPLADDLGPFHLTRLATHVAAPLEVAPARRLDAQGPLLRLKAKMKVPVMY